ncbi:MAG: DUF1592 domain-containing protein [Myxococcales bacterium]|nr:DUF1592 domain-containing protein [Myxococcales bacterium]
MTRRRSWISKSTLAGAALAIGALSTGLGACGGDDAKFGEEGGGTSTGGGTGEGGSEPLVFHPAEGGIRRLLAPQYLSTVRYFFGPAAADAVLAAELLPTDNPVSGYSAVGNASTPPGLSFPEFYELAAAEVADAAVADVQQNGSASVLASFLPCVGEATPSPTCYAQFAQQLAPMLFRRPITQEDVNWITGIAGDGLAYGNGNFYTGLRYAILGVLQTPSFLYITEVGTPDPENPGFNKLDAFELASRLSFFLTDTGPDVTLYEAARDGALESDAEIQSQASRLLATPAARDTLRRRFTEFLYLDGAMTAQKDPTIYPELDDELRQAMVEEVTRLLEDIVWTQGADARGIYTSSYTFVNATLADLYGMDPVSGGGWEKQTLPADRAGFLSSGAFLTRASHAVRTSPTRRGTFIKDRVLCEPVPPPGPGVSTVLPDPGNTPKTTKQLVEQHMSDPSCRTCHAQFDPFGFALEHFDAIGRYRDKEEGLELDTTADVWAFGAFDSPRTLAELLLSDEQARVSFCLMRNILRGSLGHIETPGEEAALRDLHDLFDASGFDLKQLLSDMTLSQAFRYVDDPTVADEGDQ